MEKRPHALLLKYPGTNCDAETARALEATGFATTILPVSQLDRDHLEGVSLVVFSGGFSYGDVRNDGLAAAPDDPAFPTWEGGPIPPDALAGHLARLRSTRINMEFNGALCRGLAQTRYKQVEIGPDGTTLVDFITGRMPPPDGATTVRN